LSTQKELLAAS